MEENDQLLMGLIYSLSETAMIALGKIQNPMSGKLERNMELAKIQIDMVRMLQKKTQGNVPKEVESFVASTLSTLELTYVQEQSKPVEKAEPEKGTAQDGDKKEVEKDKNENTEKQEQEPKEKEK